MYRSDSQLNPALTELRLLFVHSVAPRGANGGDSVRVVGLRRGGAAPHGIRTALPLHVFACAMSRVPPLCLHSIFQIFPSHEGVEEHNGGYTFQINMDKIKTNIKFWV